MVDLLDSHIPIALDMNLEKDNSGVTGDKWDVVILHGEKLAEKAETVCEQLKIIGQENCVHIRAEILGNLILAGEIPVTAAGKIFDLTTFVMFFRCNDFFEDRLNDFLVAACLQDRVEHEDPNRLWTVIPLDTDKKTKVPGQPIMNGLTGFVMSSNGRFEQRTKKMLMKLLKRHCRLSVSQASQSEPTKQEQIIYTQIAHLQQQRDLESLFKTTSFSENGHKQNIKNDQSVDTVQSAKNAGLACGNTALPALTDGGRQTAEIELTPSLTDGGRQTAEVELTHSLTDGGRQTAEVELTPSLPDSKGGVESSLPSSYHAASINTGPADQVSSGGHAVTADHLMTAGSPPFAADRSQPATCRVLAEDDASSGADPNPAHSTDNSTSKTGPRPSGSTTSMCDHTQSTADYTSRAHTPSAVCIAPAGCNASTAEGTLPTADSTLSTAESTQLTAESTPSTAEGTQPTADSMPSTAELTQLQVDSAPTIADHTQPAGGSTPPTAEHTQPVAHSSPSTAEPKQLMSAGTAVHTQPTTDSSLPATVSSTQLAADNVPSTTDQTLLGANTLDSFYKLSAISHGTSTGDYTLPLAHQSPAGNHTQASDLRQKAENPVTFALKEPNIYLGPAFRGPALFLPQSLLNRNQPSNSQLTSQPGNSQPSNRLPISQRLSSPLQSVTLDNRGLILSQAFYDQNVSEIRVQNMDSESVILQQSQHQQTRLSQHQPLADREHWNWIGARPKNTGTLFNITGQSGPAMLHSAHAVFLTEAQGKLTDSQQHQNPWKEAGQKPLPDYNSDKDLKSAMDMLRETSLTPPPENHDADIQTDNDCDSNVHHTDTAQQQVPPLPVDWSPSHVPAAAPCQNEEGQAAEQIQEQRPPEWNGSLVFGAEGIAEFGIAHNIADYGTRSADSRTRSTDSGRSTMPPR